jgi:hypothetical protein
MGGFVVVGADGSVSRHCAAHARGVAVVAHGT